MTISPTLDELRHLLHCVKLVEKDPGFRHYDPITHKHHKAAIARLEAEIKAKSEL